MENSNRIIKFRAWDKQLKEFIYAEPIYGFFPSLPTDCEGNDSHSMKHRKDQYGDIQQYTGLKDLKGIEIFEGDIVRRVSTADTIEITEVKYKAPYWTVNDYSPEYGYTIIGNIYQNPELIK